MRRLLLLLLTCFSLITCNGQAKPVDHSPTIKKQAEAMGTALLRDDWDAFVRFTYPKIVEMMGGKQNMIATMKKGMGEMKSEGTAFLGVSFGKPSRSLVRNQELQCTLPQTITMKVRNGRLVSQSTLIAISNNGGKAWYFVDTSGKDIQTLRKMLPNLSPDLVVPPGQEPKFYAD